MKAACGYLVAGIGIGAALSVCFAPKSGEETRKWVASKCFDAIDAANDRVWQSRLHVRGIMDRGQRQITEAVAAGRKSFRNHEAENPVVQWASVTARSNKPRTDQNVRPIESR
jgi:gas vesicle protein